MRNMGLNINHTLYIYEHTQNVIGECTVENLQLDYFLSMCVFLFLRIDRRVWAFLRPPGEHVACGRGGGAGPGH